MKSVSLSRRKFFGLAAGAAAVTVVPSIAGAKAPPQLTTVTPAGTLQCFAGNEAPEGFMWCYGQELKAADYSQLFDVVGRRYGGDERRGTFNLPDLRTRVPLPRIEPGFHGDGSLSHFSVPDARGYVRQPMTANEVRAANGLPPITHEPVGAGPNRVVYIDGGHLAGNTTGLHNVAVGHVNAQPPLIINYLIAVDDVRIDWTP